MLARYYQTEATESLYSYFRTSKGNPLIALPTGTGKSFVIANFMQTACEQAPLYSRFMVLTHVKELIEQNAKTLLRIWPQAPVGIYSAGLGERNTTAQIIFGGRDSVASCIEEFGHVDILIIDEAHLLSPDDNTRYFKIIEALRKRNPYLKVIGFTATKFRQGQGLLTDGGIFTDICYDMTTPQGFMRLVADGFISPPIPKRTATELEVDNVQIQRGEFVANQLNEAVNTDDKNNAAIQEALEQGHDRNCWLAFCAGVDHAENVAGLLNSYGVPAAAVHSKLSAGERDARIAAFKSGELRCITNNNILTTGFDHPPVDMILMLRPTMSTVLWIQMLGRGTRPYDANDPSQYIPGFDYTKRNCLVLDYARNTVRLGPINDPRIPRKPGEKDTPGDMPVKICEDCGTYNHTRVRYCEGCGEEFKFTLAISRKASTEALLSTPAPQVEHFDVMNVIYNAHNKQGSPPGIRATYNTGIRAFNHYILLEHPGYAAKRSRDWWRQMHNAEPPNTTAEALQMLHQLRQPRRIRVWVNKKPPEVLGYEF
jgi:DNA repair protein RadD